MDIVPLKSKQFPATHASGQGNSEERLIWMSGSRIKKAACLLSGKHVHFSMRFAWRRDHFTHIACEKSQLDGITQGFMEDDMHGSYGCGGKPFLEFLGFPGLDMLRRERLDLDLSERWNNVQTNILLVPLIGARTNMVFCAVLEPVLQILCDCLLGSLQNRSFLLLL